MTNNNSVSASTGNASNNLQHSPITNTNSNNNSDRNGGSPNQVSSLSNDLSAKCQLRKVNNLSRSDSDKESECNNNIPNAKTIRAASLACAPIDLMSEMSKKLASRRERLDQHGDNQQMSNNNVNNTNGINTDKAQETWLAEFIRNELSKEMAKMKAEIIDVIKTELRQR